jgi:hypothetical protein
MKPVLLEVSFRGLWGLHSNYPHFEIERNALSEGLEFR